MVLTGQHPDLDLAAFGMTGFPVAELDCAGQPDPYAHVAQVARRIGPAIDDTRLVVVHGDTSSALGGALGAAMTGRAVAHVEAGLRSHDRSNPWPEEDFRIAIDRAADLLFAPTLLNEANLRREGARGTIVVTGNTGIDALLEQVPRLSGPARKRVRHILVTCHRRESWGEGLKAIAGCLRRIAGLGDVTVTIVLHPNPTVATEMRRMLGCCANVELRSPCAHFDMLQRMRSSDLILSDSGGVQEEAPAFGIPLLVLRDKTERPEGILNGNAILAGRDPDTIVATVDRLLSDPRALAAMSKPALPYGDGNAAVRIGDAIAHWLTSANETAGSTCRLDHFEIKSRAGRAL